MATVGERLKEERLLRGWSQRDLAREAGTTAETISSIETGQHEPRPSTLRKLAEGLDIEVRDLFMEPALPKAEAPRGAGRTLADFLNERCGHSYLARDIDQIRSEVEAVEPQFLGNLADQLYTEFSAMLQEIKSRPRSNRPSWFDEAERASTNFILGGWAVRDKQAELEEAARKESKELTGHDPLNSGEAANS